MMNPFNPYQPDFGSPLGPSMAPIPSIMDTASAPVKRGGMFGGGSNIGTAISAALNGYLAAGGNPAGIAGLQQLHMQRMLEQRQALAEQQYARERQDKRSDFTFEQDYKAAHPGPIRNDTVNDYQFILEQLGPEAAKTFLETKTNPVVMTPYGPMPYSSVAPHAPTAPVGKLTPIDGGPTPPASGGFPY